jgi:hypothetical protein
MIDIIIMDARGKSLKTTLLALICFYVILLMKCISLNSQSWYILKIDLNKCSNCGKIIFTIGTLLEKEYGALDDKASVNDVSMDIIHRRAEHSLYGSVTEKDHVERYEDYNSIFRIENEIHMYVGLWQTYLCTEDGIYCADLDIELAPNVFAPLPLLSKIQGKKEFRIYIIQHICHGLSSVKFHVITK